MVDSAESPVVDFVFLWVRFFDTCYIIVEKDEGAFDIAVDGCRREVAHRIETLHYLWCFYDGFRLADGGRVSCNEVFAHDSMSTLDK